MKKKLENICISLFPAAFVVGMILYWLAFGY